MVFVMLLTAAYTLVFCRIQSSIFGERGVVGYGDRVMLALSDNVPLFSCN